MKKYIEQETAVSELNRIEKLYRDTYMSKVRAEMTHYCCEVIKHIPAADVRPVVHGEWIFDFALDGSNFYRCSECGRQECLLAKYSIYEFAPYCHCGAKMDGGDGGG